jgi:hypothetical protein
MEVITAANSQHFIMGPLTVERAGIESINRSDESFWSDNIYVATALSPFVTSLLHLANFYPKAFL